MVSRWSPKPEAGVRFSSPLPIYQLVSNKTVDNATHGVIIKT
tara:strand:- start:5916 stop:6041 length:126 start_codon:yes stop_codon:yes gene_type:complete